MVLMLMTDKELRNKKKREYREIRKILGLCFDCSNKTDGKVRCKECAAKNAKYYKKNIEKMRAYHRSYSKEKYYYKRDVYKNENKLQSTI